ncbi:hypothetical protein [uncultured Limosilactobacillus sp.]|uniref:hypothetical protein n=1 Tax=uncultured Limosilactobacillus sp. TaxID=2837629 RepID=UPI0025D9E983|nr:hypothetical protein [uncultured Limosilactobacillus sp.]
MIKVINYALGSKSYFDDEIKANPNRRLVMAENLTTEDNYILMDLSDQPSIFGMSIKLKTTHHVGNESFDGYLFLQAFDLPKETREMLREVGPKVLDETYEKFADKINCGYFATRMDHPQTLVMLTIWQSEEDMKDWLGSSTYNKLKDYTNQQLRNFTEVFKTVEE